MSVLFDPSRYFSVMGLASELLVGAKLYWYEAGTATPIDTFSDRALTTENANPVVSLADGRFPQIWLADDTGYKWIFTDADSTPASPLATQDNYFTPPAQVSFDPALTDFLNGDSALPIANGGTDASSAVDALSNLGGMGIVGGAFTGQITRATKGGYIHNSNSGMAGGEVFLQAIGGAAPTMANGDWLAEY